MSDVREMRIGPEIPEGYEETPGECANCGGQCAPECGKHPRGCFFGGDGRGYWMIAEGCTLDHGETKR